jgi:hypothetical protein
MNKNFEILGKIKSPYKEILAEINEVMNDYAHQISEFQNENDPLNIDFNYIKENLPTCIMTATCYRALEFEITDLDYDDLDNSIRKLINQDRKLESWSLDKEAVDNMGCSLNPSYYAENPVMVRLKATSEGLYLPKFWRELTKTYFKYNIKKVEEIFNISLRYFEGEQEFLIPPPNHYTIYNHEEIYEVLDEWRSLNEKTS